LIQPVDTSISGIDWVKMGWIHICFESIPLYTIHWLIQPLILSEKVIKLTNTYDCEYQISNPLLLPSMRPPLLPSVPSTGYLLEYLLNALLDFINGRSLFPFLENK
jgi:hypothetical protein